MTTREIELKQQRGDESLPRTFFQLRRPAFRSIEELDEPLVKREPCRTLANARVVWADYNLIRQDFADINFAAIRQRGEVTSAISDGPDIDAWVLRHAAVMSEAQMNSVEANEEIPVCGPTRIAYRPPRYGRALVVQLKDSWPEYEYLEPHRRPQGLLDVKGCGVAAGQVALPQFHRSGLLGLAGSIRELIFQRIIERVFARTGMDVRGVGIYAILDLGFRIKVGGGSFMPASAIVRCAHRRTAGNIERPTFGSEQHRIKLAIEFVLRRFGITSCNPIGRLRIWREGKDLRSSTGPSLDEVPSATLEKFLRSVSSAAPLEFDLLNVQFVRDATMAPFCAELVDFGHYYVGMKSFVTPLASLVRNRRLNWGGFIDSDSPHWIQSDPGMAVDQRLLGVQPTPPGLYEWFGESPPAQTTGAAIFSMELTRDWISGRIAPSDLENRMLEYIDSATMRLDDYQRIGEVNGGRQHTVVSNHRTIEAGLPACLSEAFDFVDGFLAENEQGLKC